MADPNNKWTQPAAPPAPMFFGKKERNLVKQVNDELSERVIGQPIAYYPISIEESNFNTVYGEAIEKVCLPPVRAFAYVVVENEQTNERYGYEYQTKLTVNFSSKRLTADQNLYVRVGDFVQYGDFFYEIVRTYNDTRYYFGQVEHKFQISAECIRVREDSFKVMPAITRQPPSTTVSADGSALPAPRTAPYPPVNASYVLVGGNNRVTNSRVLTAGTGISIVDSGRLGPITIASTAQNAVGPTGSIQFQSGAGAFSGSANLTFLTSSNVMAIAGGLSASVNISASAYYGDGSNLSGVGGTPGGSTTQIQFNSAGTFGGSSNLTFNGTTLTGSYTGSLGQFTTVSSSFMNLAPISGTMAGSGSYLALDANNNIVLATGDGSTTSPAGANTQLQYNNAGTFGASANLTFDGTALTVVAGAKTPAIAVTGQITASNTISASSFHGDGSSLTGIVSAPAGATTQIQYNSAGSFAGSANFTIVGSTLSASALSVGPVGEGIVLRVDGSGGGITAYEPLSGTILRAITLSGSLMNLAPTSGTLAGGGSYLGLDSNNNVILSAGDGATTSPATPVNSVQFNSAGAFGGSSNLTFDGTSLGIGTDSPTYTLDVAGDAGFNEYIYHNGDTNTFIRFVPDRMYIEAGGENMLYLVSGSGGDQNAKVTINNDLVDVDFQVKGASEPNLIRTDALTDRVGIGVYPAAASLHVSSSGDQVLFRVDGATAGATLFVTGSGRVGIGTTTPSSILHVAGDTQIDGNTTLGDASGDSVTINAQTIALANVAAGTDNTVLVYDGSSIVTDEIDSRVWGSTLVDTTGTPVDNQVGIWTDTNTMEGSANLTFNGTTLTGSYTGSLAQFTTVSASFANLAPISGTLAGAGSYLGLDSNNNVILSAGDGATTSPATPVNSIQFNNASAFGGSSDLTYDSSTSFMVLSGTMALSSSDDKVAFRIDNAQSTTLGPALFVTGSRGSDGAARQSVGIGTDDPQYALDVRGYLSIGSMGSGYIFVHNDSDTHIRFGQAGSDSMRFVAGAVNFLEFDENGRDWSLFNSASADVDFQVRTLTNTASFFVEGSTDRVGIGTSVPSHTLTTAGNTHLSGGLIHKHTTVAANYTASASDYILGVSVAPISIELDATAFTRGQVLLIKDQSGTSIPATPITLAPAGSQTIDGDASATVESPYGAVFVYTNGSNWFIY